MASPDRPAFTEMTDRDFEDYIRDSFRFTPDEEAEIADGVQRVTVSILDLPLGEDPAVLEEQVYPQET